MEHGPGLSSSPRRWRVTLVLTTVTLTATLVGPRPAIAGPPRFGSDGAKGVASGTHAPPAPAAIPDNCSNPTGYPAFGKVCVKGSSWAPPGLVAADTHDPAPGHFLNVVSNGPTTNVVSGKNYYGLKWQCTELAVRWADVAWGEGGDAAWTAAGWTTGAAQDMGQAAARLPHPLQVIPNGNAQAPQPGDLLLFHENAGQSGPGHVAVVIKVDRSAGKLTFVGQNEYSAPAVVSVPISAANHVSTTGFSSTIHVSKWLHDPAWSWSTSTTITPSSGHPADPICTNNDVDQGTTSLTLQGTNYPPGDSLTIRSVNVLLGGLTVPGNGSWTFSFGVPRRPDGNYAVTVEDSTGVRATLTFVSSAYTCFAWRDTDWKWDAVGWDANSPMAFFINGVQVDQGTASGNGVLPARHFLHDCPTGDNAWEVTGTLAGGFGYATGTFTCP